MHPLGILRPIKDNELDLMRCWRNAPNVRANMYTQHEITAEEHLEWWQQIQHSKKHEYFMFEFDGTPLGIVAFTGIDQVNKNSSWAFYSATNAPKGTGSRMEYLALEYAFNTLGLKKLCCEVLAFNLPVISLHRKFGFTEEGVMRCQHRVDEAFVDIHLLGILDEEWRQKKGGMKRKLEGFSGSVK